jgi:RNA polymerase sigma-54 factor
MTPQLQQAVKLLQYNRAELAEFITSEMLENPTLEENDDSPEQLEVEAANKAAADLETGSATDQSEEQVVDTATTEIDWNRVDMNDRVMRPASSAGDDLPGYDQTLHREETMSEHLLWQLRMQPLNERAQAIGVLIVGNLNDYGYFDGGAEGFARLIDDHDLDRAAAEEVRQEIRLLDPIGVGSLGLRECLLLQLSLSDAQGSPAWRLVDHHLEALDTKDLRGLSRLTGLSIEEIDEGLAVIGLLEPRPGRRFTSSEAERNPFITPDVRVCKEGGEWVVHLNEDGMPRLRVSRFYRDAYASGSLSETDRAYVIERLRRAEWVTKSIFQRQNTIRRVVESLLRFQREFFEHGPAHLRPLVLRDVADDIGMHESTVSRVTSNKYAETPQGLLQLKSLFSARIASRNGDDVSAEAVRQRLSVMIRNEDPAKPYSDADLVKLLRADGTEIARRTVAKYRDQLFIPAAGKRRVRR